MSYVLQGAAQSCPIPLRNFKWLSEKEIEDIDISTLQEDDEIGYVFEVDLHYPETLHFKHNNFGLAPQSFNITDEHLSDYAKECYKAIYGKEKYSATKLVSTFYDRKDYVVHGMNLKCYLALGMQLIKITKVLSFTQSRFLKPFIDKCTDLRRQSTSQFHSNFYKLVRITYIHYNLKSVMLFILFRLPMLILENLCNEYVIMLRLVSQQVRRQSVG